MPYSGDCFSNVSQVFQNNLAKKYNARNHIYCENSQADTLYVCTKHENQLEILISSTIYALYTNFERLFWVARETSVKHPWRPR